MNEIIKAELSDLDEIYAIEQSSFAEPWSRVSVEAEFYKDYSVIYICKVSGRIAGYIIVWELGCEAEVVTVAVDESFRNRGIGSELIKFVLDNFPEGSLWHLEVACDNLPAIRIYEKFGFIETSIIKDYYGKGRNAYRMLRGAI